MLSSLPTNAMYAFRSDQHTKALYLILIACQAADAGAFISGSKFILSEYIRAVYQKLDIILHIY